VRVPAEEAVPLRAPAAAFALDIELTIDRWVLGAELALAPPLQPRT
jgi:hypothetical protein